MSEHEHPGHKPVAPALARRDFVVLAGKTIGVTVATALLAACGGGATVVPTPATAAPGSTVPPQAATKPSPTSALSTGTPIPPATATAATTTSRATATTLPMPSPTGSVAAPATAARAALTPAASATPGLVAVRIVDFAFDPATVTIPVGTTVLWTNTGVEHTTTSSDNVWGSEVMERGDTFRYQFTRPGTYPYICGLHPDMQATVIVQ